MAKSRCNDTRVNSVDEASKGCNRGDAVYQPLISTHVCCVGLRTQRRTTQVDTREPRDKAKLLIMQGRYTTEAYLDVFAALPSYTSSPQQLCPGFTPQIPHVTATNQGRHRNPSVGLPVRSSCPIRSGSHETGSDRLGLASVVITPHYSAPHHVGSAAKDRSGSTSV